MTKSLLLTAGVALALAPPSIGHCVEHTPIPNESARPADVDSIEHLMRAFYEVVNLKPDQPRQWGRDHTLYSPWIRFIAIGAEAPKVDVDVWTHQELVDATEPLIRSGFREREISRSTAVYGNIAHVDSTYEARIGAEGHETTQRGVNSLQLYFDGTRWWIASVMWQTEGPAYPIPEQWLPTREPPQQPIGKNASRR